MRGTATTSTSCDGLLPLSGPGCLDTLTKPFTVLDVKPSYTPPGIQKLCSGESSIMFKWRTH